MKEIDFMTGAGEAGGWCFATTRWSVVACTGGEEEKAVNAALAMLCQAYWRPIYAEIRRRGHGPEDAQDLTQEFFACLLRRQSFGRADRGKGRFRSYLLGALDYFLTDMHRRRTAEKRGGGQPAVTMDGDEAERWLEGTASPHPDPAAHFDHRWALTIMDQAFVRLQGEYEGRAELFAEISPFLAADSGGEGYAAPGTKLGMTKQAVAVAVHRMRQRYRNLVRREVEMTLANPAEVDAELRHLFGL